MSRATCRNTLAGEMSFWCAQIKTHPAEAHIAHASIRFRGDTGIERVFRCRRSFRPEYDTHEFPNFRNCCSAGSMRHSPCGESTMVDHRDPYQLAERSTRMETTVKRLESRTTIIFVLWMLGASVVISADRGDVSCATRCVPSAAWPKPPIISGAASTCRISGRTAPRSAQGGARLHRHARTHPAADPHAHRNAGRHLARSAHAADAHETATGHAAGARKRGELGDDVQQMEHMIQEYLDFARGDGREEATRIRCATCCRTWSSDYQRVGAMWRLHGRRCSSWIYASSGFRRMLHNLDR